MDSVRIIGEKPLETDDTGMLKSHIGTYFIPTHTLVTLPGMPHVIQQIKYREILEAEYRARGKNLSETEWSDIQSRSVDLIMQGRDLLIRPLPSRMDDAFEADQALQTLVPKHHIRFLHAQVPEVRKAIQARGENWRVSPTPQGIAMIIYAIKKSKVAIGGLPLYYYNASTGTRYLTCQEFRSLEGCDSETLRRHLVEIKTYTQKFNASFYSEIELFAADRECFSAECFERIDFETLSEGELRSIFGRLASAFEKAVPEHLRQDNTRDPQWRQEMFRALSDPSRGIQTDELPEGLTPEFYLQLRWLPGGRIEEGSLVFDPVFSYCKEHPEDKMLSELCDQRVQGFICNYIREFGNIRYVNIAGIMPDLRRHPPVGGHCAYLAEIMCEGMDTPVTRMIRIQRWGIKQHLDMGRDLLWATTAATEYTQYTLNRRLACWELGMPLPLTLSTNMVYEVYSGKQKKYRGTPIWTTYFERDILPGYATDKIAKEYLGDLRFSKMFARLLGDVAAPNLVVGRREGDGEITFDQGDEILLLSEENLPEKLIVADHAGTFSDTDTPFSGFADAYAEPVLSRWEELASPVLFMDNYLEAFGARLRKMQANCPRYRHLFDALFQYNNRKGDGSFRDRWEKAIGRLEESDIDLFIDAVRQAILKRSPSSCQ